jgi:hypothetical protein
MTYFISMMTPVDALANCLADVQDAIARLGRGEGK